MPLSPIEQPEVSQSVPQSEQHCAVLGGTFDPVHIGHLRIAIQLQEAGFDRVIMMPNRTPPHRSVPGATPEQRLHMLQLATQDLDGIEVSSLELDRPDYSYSAVTLETLRELNPGSRFTWTLGTDAWLGFDRWHRCDDILAMANLLIIQRPGKAPEEPTWQASQLAQRESNLSELLASSQGKICQLAWPELDISASALREAIHHGENIRFLTPDPVLHYLQQQPIYR